MEENQVKTTKFGEVLNMGMNFKFAIPVHEMQELDNYVSCGITIHVGDMKINGILNKVSTWKKKEKGEIVGIYRQIDVSITSMNSVSGNEVLQIPDKKFQIMEDFSITIGVI